MSIETRHRAQFKQEERKMKTPISDIAFTPSVKTVQDSLGSRDNYARMEKGDNDWWPNHVTPELADFISKRDSFYLATANVNGQPYIQHRGGPKGFLKVLDDRTLAFADFRGNRQYISYGNLQDNNKAFIFLMDYPNRRRIKIWGTAQVVDNDPELLEKLTDSSYRGKPERAFVFKVEVWDGNCPQHIVPRFSEEEIKLAVQPLHERIDELESENEKLRLHVSKLSKEDKHFNLTDATQ